VAGSGCVAKHVLTGLHAMVFALQNARNVLVASCSSMPAGVTAKLADLGLSRSIKQHATHRTTNTVRRQPGWLARCSDCAARVILAIICTHMVGLFTETGAPSFRKRMLAAKTVVCTCGLMYRCLASVSFRS
jgi:hypothetical protein